MKTCYVIVTGPWTGNRSSRKQGFSPWNCNKYFNKGACWELWGSRRINFHLCLKVVQRRFNKRKRKLLPQPRKKSKYLLGRTLGERHIFNNKIFGSTVAISGIDQKKTKGKCQEQFKWRDLFFLLSSASHVLQWINELSLELDHPWAEMG